MKPFIILFLLISLVSCSANRKVRRAQKHIDKARIINPGSFIADTIRDTIIIPKKTLEQQTTIKTILRQDTIKMIDTITQVKVNLIKEKEVLKVQAECPADTVTIEKVVEKIKYVQNLDEITRLEKVNKRQGYFITILGILNIAQLGVILLQKFRIF